MTIFHNNFIALYCSERRHNIFSFTSWIKAYYIATFDQESVHDRDVKRKVYHS